MATSRLNASFVYPENRGVFTEDENHETDLYEMTLFDVDVVFGLGNPKQFGSIVFFPMYLIHDSVLHSQIGVFEIPFERMSTVYDEDGELHIQHLGDPLLYSYVNRRILQRVSDSSDLCEQSALMAKAERESYRRAKGDPWICRFLSNPHFDLLPARPSWFHILEDAFEHKISVDQLRTLYAESVPEELYIEEALRYKRAKGAFDTLTSELKQFVEEHRRLKERIRTTTDRKRQLEIVDLAEQISNRHKETLAERNHHKDVLKPLQYLSNVRSFADFQTALRSSDMVNQRTVLEQALRTQFILFSKHHYDGGQPTHVVRFTNCGDPKRYIMVALERKGDTLSLVTYKGHRCFDFARLPYDVKMWMAQRCMESNSRCDLALRQFMKERHLSLPHVNIYDKWCDPRNRLVIHGEACEGVLPGEEHGETVDASFVKVAVVPKWRRKLSNEWICPFELDGKRWASVHHYVYSKGDEFSLDSGSELSKQVLDVSSTKRAFDQTAEERAVEAKFTQHPELCDLLRATRDALLLHYEKGAPPTPVESLMKMRHHFIIRDNVS